MNYMNAKAFVDTNVLVYAHDASAVEKHEIAKSLIDELWIEKTGVLSTQVLQEFYVTVRRKVPKPVNISTAKRWISDYLNWTIIENDGITLLRAMDVEQRYQIAFWDATIIQAATQADVTLLYSEDLNHGQLYGKVRVENPFSH
jgi:predicted nucleic acid-binding protein